jgi:tetratricopeptide (TPR) repeat protein
VLWTILYKVSNFWSMTIVVGLIAAAPAVAQQAAPPQQAAAAPTPQMRAAYDAAFQATLAKPADPDTLVKFADLAVQVGDYEGAISALERLLLIDGDQPEVKLELGVLYVRLGSFEAARNYFEEVLVSPTATEELKDKAEDYLEKTAKP